jgi:hypothetical protein
MNDYVIFDIETKPRPDLVERFGEKYPEFDASAVKYGNTRDPIKREEILAQKRADHETEREAFFAKQRERAALNPYTAEVLCVGALVAGEEEIMACDSERETLESFWRLYGTAHRTFYYYSGNGNTSGKFDPDMLVTRSRILGVTVPPSVRRGRYYSDRFVDLAEEFLLGKRDAFLSLTRCADILGAFDNPATTLRRKQDDDPVTGANFHKFWEAGGKSRELAASYLVNDLNLAAYIAARIL